MPHVCSSSFPLLNIDVCLCFYTSASFSSNITFSFLFLLWVLNFLSLSRSLSLCLSASFSLLQPPFLIALYLSMSLSGSCSFSLCQSVSVSLSLFFLNSFCFVSWSLYISHRLSHIHITRYIVIVHLFVCLSCHVFFCFSFSFSLCPSVSLSLCLSPIVFGFFLFLSFLSFLYFFLSVFLSLIFLFLSIFFLSLSVSLYRSASLSICLNVPFCECVSHSFFIVSMSQKFSSCLVFVTTTVSLSIFLMVAVGFLCVYTTFFLSILFRFCVLHCLTQRVPGIQHLFSSLSLGDRYSNRRVQESTLMEQHKVHLTQHVQGVHYLAFEDRYSSPRVQTPVLVYVNRPHLIMEHVHIGWPATTDEPQFKT